MPNALKICLDIHVTGGSQNNSISQAASRTIFRAIGSFLNVATSCLKMANELISVFVQASTNFISRAKIWKPPAHVQALKKHASRDPVPFDALMGVDSITWGWPWQSWAYRSWAVPTLKITYVEKFFVLFLYILCPYKIKYLVTLSRQTPNNWAIFLLSRRAGQANPQILRRIRNHKSANFLAGPILKSKIRKFFIFHLQIANPLISSKLCPTLSQSSPKLRLFTWFLLCTNFNNIIIYDICKEKKYVFGELICGPPTFAI